MWLGEAALSVPATALSKASTYLSGAHVAPVAGEGCLWVASSSNARSIRPLGFVERTGTVVSLRLLGPPLGAGLSLLVLPASLAVVPFHPPKQEAASFRLSWVHVDQGCVLALSGSRALRPAESLDREMLGIEPDIFTRPYEAVMFCARPLLHLGGPPLPLRDAHVSD